MRLRLSRLGLLNEILPAATKIAVLFNPKRPDFESLSKDLVSAAQARGVDIVTLTAANSQEIDEISATLSQMHVGALLVSADPFLLAAHTQLMLLASRLSLPTMFVQREAVESGGLMSYGTGIPEGYRQAGVYVGRILKGEKPADLPIAQPTKFDLVINEDREISWPDHSSRRARHSRRGDRIAMSFAASHHVAQSGHFAVEFRCPLLGVKRT